MTVQTDLTSKSDDSETNWDSIANSPLVEGEGESRTLKLQFDLSQFDPEEVKLHRYLLFYTSLLYTGLFPISHSYRHRSFKQILI